MNTLSVRVSYRPVRIGWCVLDGDFVGLERVLRLTHCFWGGRFNPVIPIGNARLAKQLVDLFRVDALFGASSSAEVRDFIAEKKHLPWPDLHEDLFLDGYHGREPELLDVRAALVGLRELAARYGPSPGFRAVQAVWPASDPLAMVFLATLGGYASADQTGIDYARAFASLPDAEQLEITVNGALPGEALVQWLTPSVVTALDLHDFRLPSLPESGLYIGRAGDFLDLVTFWNLRAANIDVVFYDPAHSLRLDHSARTHCDALTARPRPRFPGPLDDRLALWSQMGADVAVPPFVQKPLLCSANEGAWNGLNVRPGLMRLEPQWCLGILDQTGNGPAVSLQLPPPPVPREVRAPMQHVVVSVSPGVHILRDDTWTLNVPNIPELNEYLGREAHFAWNRVRVEPEGIGIIEHLSTTQITVRALETTRLFAEIFKLAGIEARPSAAGLICRRIIESMGGLQGCRPFKIRGVRDLLAKYSALKSFPRGAAVRVIGMVDPVTNKPDFARYEHLVIEHHSRGGLKPDQVLDYLCRVGVFRVGLEFQCEHCGQRFWRHLDLVQELSQCEYCGTTFRVTPQLRDRDWRFRRSGLFGRDNNQEGAVPVALVLQQLETALHSAWLAYSSGLNLRSLNGKPDVCETDFAIILRDRDGIVQLAIGEAKAGRPIEAVDVENLRRVAEAFPRHRVEVFLIFAKTTAFTPEEVELCRRAQDPHEPNVILLSDRELEPYFIYEHAAKAFEINQHAVCLEDMARNTNDIYFQPRRRDTNTGHVSSSE